MSVARKMASLQQSWRLVSGYVALFSYPHGLFESHSSCFHSPQWLRRKAGEFVLVGLSYGYQFQFDNIVEHEWLILFVSTFWESAATSEPGLPTSLRTCSSPAHNLPRPRSKPLGNQLCGQSLQCQLNRMCRNFSLVALLSDKQHPQTPQTQVLANSNRTARIQAWLWL